MGLSSGSLVSSRAAEELMPFLKSTALRSPAGTQCMRATPEQVLSGDNVIPSHSALGETGHQKLWMCVSLPPGAHCLNLGSKWMLKTRPGTGACASQKGTSGLTAQGRKMSVTPGHIAHGPVISGSPLSLWVCFMPAFMKAIHLSAAPSLHKSLIYSVPKQLGIFYYCLVTTLLIFEI